MIDIRPNPDEVDAAWLTEVVAKRGFTGEVTTSRQSLSVPAKSGKCSIFIGR